MDRCVGRRRAASTGDAIETSPWAREGVYGEPRQLRRWGRRADGVHRYCHDEGDRATGCLRCGAQGTPAGVARCGTDGDAARNSRRVALTVPVGVFHSWRQFGRSRSPGPEGLSATTHGLVLAGRTRHRGSHRPRGRRRSCACRVESTARCSGPGSAPAKSASSPRAMRPTHQPEGRSRWSSSLRWRAPRKETRRRVPPPRCRHRCDKRNPWGVEWSCPPFLGTAWPKERRSYRRIAAGSVCTSDRGRSRERRDRRCVHARATDSMSSIAPVISHASQREWRSASRPA